MEEIKFEDKDVLTVSVNKEADPEEAETEQDVFPVINSVLKGELHVKEEIIKEENEQFVDQLAGWGRTENTKPSDVLMYADLPVVDYRQCIDTLPEVFQHYVTPDKFCGGFDNGTGAAKGDSGGGLTFVHDDLHCVYEIVSTKVVDVDSFITFTSSVMRNYLTGLITGSMNLMQYNQKHK